MKSISIFLTFASPFSVPLAIAVDACISCSAGKKFVTNPVIAPAVAIADNRQPLAGLSAISPLVLIAYGSFMI